MGNGSVCPKRRTESKGNVESADEEHYSTKSGRTSSNSGQVTMDINQLSQALGRKEFKTHGPEKEQAKTGSSADTKEAFSQETLQEVVQSIGVTVSGKPWGMIETSGPPKEDSDKTGLGPDDLGFG